MISQLHVWQVHNQHNDDAVLEFGPLYGEFIGYRWIPITIASDAEF